MAYRIADHVEKGEIDNREPGKVIGKLWVRGLKEPVLLELQGNAATDLAGCLLTFENRGEIIPIRKDASFSLLQRGSIGDLTASRKVRVFDLPFAEAYDRKKKGLPVPEHMANCLYLEWFSDFNGRVVIEGVDFQLSISTPAWRLSPEEEKRRQKDAAAGFGKFLEQINSALEAAKHETAPEKPFDEFDYEKLLRESDARTDKLMELYDKYQNEPNSEEIIEREMGWAGTEEEPPKTSGNDLKDEGDAIEIPDDLEEPVPDPLTEGRDWVRDEDGHISHPLARRAFEGSVRLTREFRKLGLNKTENEELILLVSEYQITGAKLAGALNSLAYGRDHQDPAFTVACLKRALGHLQKAQAALEKVAQGDGLPKKRTSNLRTEFFGLREEILRLMTEFRN